MKKSILLFFFLSCIQVLSQTGKVGIDTSAPTETFHVNGTVRLGSLPTNGTTNAIYTINSSTATNGIASTVKDQTFIQEKFLVVDKNGVIGKADIPGFSQTGPTKFISGIVTIKFNSNSGGTLDTVNLIGGSSGVNYLIGLANANSNVGGLMSITGLGYKISQVSNGVFDIKFDSDFIQIYSLVANIYDTGNSGSGPNTSTPQNILSTLDQIQIGYISNSIIRVHTADSAGNEASRSFTFMASGI